MYIYIYAQLYSEILHDNQYKFIIIQWPYISNLGIVHIGYFGTS